MKTKSVVVLKSLQAGLLMFGVILLAVAVVGNADAGLAASSANSIIGGGTLASIPLAEFEQSKNYYIGQLVPGSNNPDEADYYARPSFYNSERGKARFATSDGGEIVVYDGEVELPIKKKWETDSGEEENNCESILGMESYLVDFTGTELAKIQRASNNVDSGAWDVRTRAQKAAMLQNTLYLQWVEYCAPKGTTITIPKGEYYFAIGHHQNVGFGEETYVLKPVSGVNIFGRGIGTFKSAIDAAIKTGNTAAIDAAANTTNGTNATILKPYTSAAFSEEAAPDMFFYNEYAATGFSNLEYLNEINYYNFIIDGEDAVGTSYTSQGKGFMYNVFELVNWDSVVVMNTDGTGFGVDSPKSSIIKNSLAYNNGKKATPNDGTGNEYPGASGFGIGTGFADNESLRITHSVAYGNAKFGFFFEHQNRFQSPLSVNYPYDAIRGGGYNTIERNNDSASFIKKAFMVDDSLGAKNYYNFGGMRAYDTSVGTSTSVAGCTGAQAAGTYYSKTTCTNANVFYSGDTRRVSVNVGVDIMFSDVTDPSEWYYDAVKWAVESGVVYGVSGNKFGVKEQMYRRDALTIIWRMMGYPGDVITKRNENQSSINVRSQDVRTCFADVPGDAYYAGAVRWAYYDRTPRIITGSQACSSESSKDGLFDPDAIVKRSEFVTMLYRLAGEPAVSGRNNFTDVSEDAWYYKAALWASQNGITMGVGENKFAPDSDCTREQVVTFLHRYYQKYGTR